MTEAKTQRSKLQNFCSKAILEILEKIGVREGGGVMIVTKHEYDIQGIELETNISAETVWATITLKDQHKLVVRSYYRPPDSRSDSIDDIESVLSFITKKI